MPDILVRVGLSADDIAQLRQLPEQIETLIRTAQGVIDGIRSGASGDNPLAGMFGALAGVARDAAAIPGIDDLLGRLRELLDGLPTAGFGDITQLRGAIDEVVKLLGPVIKKTGVLLGDLTGANPNVLHEVGLAEGLNKTALLIMERSEAEPPVNLGYHGVVAYDPHDARWPLGAVEAAATLLRAGLEGSARRSGLRPTRDNPSPRGAESS